MEHGKIGDRIAVVLNGKQIYKKLYKPTNPQTPKQQQHRAKIAFVNRLAAVLADAVNLGFALVPKPGSMQSPRNAFVKTNWDNGSIIWNEDNGEWALCPERLLVAYGPRHIDGSITASVDNGKLHISCTNPRLKERNAVDDDQLMVAVYRPAIPTMHLYEGPLRKECGECDFMLPTDTSGEDTSCMYTHGSKPPYITAPVVAKIPSVPTKQVPASTSAVSTYSTSDTTKHFRGLLEPFYPLLTVELPPTYPIVTIELL